MKKHFASLLSIIILLCTACGDKQTSNNSEVSHSSNSSEVLQSSDSSNIPSRNNIGNEPVVPHENPRVDYTRDEVRDIVEQYSNLKISSDYFYVSVPKTIDHVSEFYNGSAYQLPPEKELEEFKSVFKYLFPDHELDENCLYASAHLDDTDPDEYDIFKTLYHSLKNEDNYNAYMNCTLGNQKYLHNLVYTEEQFPRENSVSLTYRSPFGNDYCEFNKGVCNKLIANRSGEDKYYAWELCRLSENGEDLNPLFEFVGAYPPDSEKTFKLLDKEISIKDAVSFFEKYIADIPCADEPVFGLHINDVNVFKLDDEHYGYEFLNSRIYDGILFNYVWDGAGIDGINRDMSCGIMVKSDDVDGVYSPFNAWKAYDEVRHTEFVQFEEAVKTISENMTDYVGFEVTRAEMVFRKKSNAGVSDQVGDTRYPTYPSWKMTLYNPNDNLIYVTFVNALSGEFEGGR